MMCSRWTTSARVSKDGTSDMWDNDQHGRVMYIIRWQILFRRTKMTLQSAWLESDGKYAFQICVGSECPIYVSSRFSDFFSRNRNHLHFLYDLDCHGLQLVCHCEVGNYEIEDKDAVNGILRDSLYCPVFLRPTFKSKFPSPSNCWSCRSRCSGSGRID